MCELQALLLYKDFFLFCSQCLRGVGGRRRRKRAGRIWVCPASQQGPSCHTLYNAAGSVESEPHCSVGCIFIQGVLGGTGQTGTAARRCWDAEGPRALGGVGRAQAHRCGPAWPELSSFVQSLCYMHLAVQGSPVGSGEAEATFWGWHSKFFPTHIAQAAAACGVVLASPAGTAPSP